MKKILCFLLTCMLSGCSSIPFFSSSSSSPDSTEDTYSQALHDAEGILSQLGIEDNVKQLKDRNVRGMIFDGEEIATDAAVFLRDDDIAEFVGVFYVNDLEKAKQDIQNYVSSLKSMTNIYDSTEIFKIDNAVLRDNGKDKIVLIIDKDVETSKKLAEKAVK